MVSLCAGCCIAAFNRRFPRDGFTVGQMSPRLSAAEAVDRYASDLELRARMLRAYRCVGDDYVNGPTTWLMLHRHLFSLWLHHTRVIPRFQLTADGTPRPAMQDILAAWDAVHPRLQHSRIVEDWDLALWMFAPSPLLDNQQPYRLLRPSPGQVLDAVAALGSSSNGSVSQSSQRRVGWG